MFLPSEAVAVSCSLMRSYLEGTIKINDVHPDVSESIMGANNKHTALCLSFFKLEVYTF
jgi:hypothetical protein